METKTGRDAFYVALHDPVSPTTNDKKRQRSPGSSTSLTAPSPPPYQRHSLWTWQTVAIPMTYICVGLLLSFPSAYIEYFPRTLQATDAQLSTVQVVRALPWSIKVLFGILPDNLPLRQLRFKPYMLLGYTVSSWFHFLLAYYGESLSVFAFSILLLGAMMGTVMADVMGDALVTSRVIKKQEAHVGQTQAIVYLCRYCSEMVGYWSGALLSNRAQWRVGLTMRQVFGFLALLPLLTVVPCLFWLDEPRAAPLASWAQQKHGLWIMLQRRATWQPLCFLALFNAFLLHNAAWGNYLNIAFQFSAFQYGALSAISATVTFLSVVLYRQWVLVREPDSWHAVYFITGIVASLFSVLSVLLVFHVNSSLGIPAFWFAVGDSAIISFAKGFQQLPVAIMLVSVCPENQEGIAYALLTSIVNLAQAFAQTISNMLLRIWPVELPDLRRGDYSGVWKLTLLTALVALLPLAFIRMLLPRGSTHQESMLHDFSVRGAQLVSAVYVFGFVWVVSLTLVAMAEPCNVFVGGHGCPPTH